MALSEVSPDALAVVVVEAVLDQIDELALTLLPRQRWLALRGVERGRATAEQRRALVLDTPLGRTVRDLARYAQTGDGLPAWEVPAAILGVELALLGRAADQVEGGIARVAADGRLPEAVRVVVLAADARLGVERGRAVSAMGFAVLAGLSVKEVEGQFGACVDAETAEAWLRRRRVVGFGVGAHARQV